MTDLIIRKIPFAFDETVPFQWQPENPAFGMFCNVFTFIAVPFEKYIITVVRRAEDRFADPAVKEEAEAFLQQEGLHAGAHRKHMKALIAKYPGLSECYDIATNGYNELLASQPIEFHFAYIANLEATFTPMFKLILDNRASLFDGGDARVASLMMWHFVEEIEHRSSGLILSDYIAPNSWYRTKQIKATFAHVTALTERITEAFDRHVPEEDRVVSAAQAMSTDLFLGELKQRGPWARWTDKPIGAPTLFHGVPTRDLLTMLWRLALSQTPRHDPARQPLPQWADVWMREYDRGTDMTAFYGVKNEEPAS